MVVVVVLLWMADNVRRPSFFTYIACSLDVGDFVVLVVVLLLLMTVNDEDDGGK